jgi:hypothetical protein
MRMRLVSLLTLILGVLLVSMTSVTQGAGGKGWKCTTPNVNCKGANCFNPPDYSCGLITAIDHPKCYFTGLRTDECEVVDRNCAMITYYAGGNCNNNVAPYCKTDIPVGVPPTYEKEAGCHPPNP